MEEEDNFLDKMANTLSIFASNKDGPVVGVSFHCGLLSPLSRVAQDQLDLYGLRVYTRVTSDARARRERIASETRPLNCYAKTLTDRVFLILTATVSNRLFTVRYLYRRS